MARYSLTSYTIRLQDKDSKIYLPLGQFEDKQDLFILFNDYLTDRKGYTVDQELQRLLRVTHRRKLRDYPRTVRGRVVTGEYGFETDLYDMVTGEVVHKRSSSQVELMPFYFLAYLPKQEDKGILVLQRRGVAGIRSVFLNDFVRCFNESYPEIVIEVNSLVPKSSIDQYLQNGRVVEARFISRRIPSDVVDAYGGVSELQEEDGIAEFVIKTRKNLGLATRIGRGVREVYSGEKRVTEMMELGGFNYDNIKVRVELNKRYRTFDLSNFMKQRVNYDITDEVDLGQDGHPEFDSIDSIALEYLEDLRSTLF